MAYRATLFLLALMLLAGEAAAQEARVQLALSAQEAYLGETITVQVVVDGAEADGPPVFAATKAFVIEPDGVRDASTHIRREVNGVVTTEDRIRFIYQFQARALKSGRQILPSATITVKGQEQRTQTVPITVLEPEETEALKLRIAVSKERPFVGEPIILRVTLYLRQNLRDLSFAPPDRERFSLSGRDMDRAGAGQQLIKTEVFGEETLCAQGSGSLDGVEFTTLTFEKTLVAKEPGRQRFGPLLASIEAVVGRKRRLGFFEDPDVVKRFVIPSNVLELDVRSLPSPPANFSGLIGAGELEASAEPKEVRVGDPITLTLRGRCPPPLSRLKLPGFEHLTDRFKVSRAPGPPTIADGWKSTRRTVRARGAAVTEIPAFELVYFDTEDGAYKAARTDPIPLTVEESQGVQAESFGSEERLRGRALRSLDAGIAANVEGPEVLAKRGFELTEALRSPTAFLALAPLALALLIVAGRSLGALLRRAPSRRARLKTLLGEARSALEADQGDPRENAASASRALRRVVAAITESEAREITEAEARALLAERYPDQAAAFADFFEACERARFAAEAEGVSMEARGRELLDGLGRAMLKGER